MKSKQTDAQLSVPFEDIENVQPADNLTHEDEQIYIFFKNLQRHVEAKEYTVHKLETAYFLIDVVKILKNIIDSSLEMSDSEIANCINSIDTSALNEEQKAILHWFATKTLAIPREKRQAIAKSDAGEHDKARAANADKALMPIDKISKSVFDIATNSDYNNESEVRLRISPREAKKEVRTLVTIKLNELAEAVNISRQNQLTAYDYAVLNAVMSLHAAGNQYVTTAMIYRAMMGNKGQSPKKKTRKLIEDSMRELSIRRISIDATAEGQSLYPALKGFKQESYLMPVHYAQAEINGEIVDCYKILEEPILYSYARKKNQIASCDINLLNTPLQHTQENIALTSILLSRISIMKSQRARYTDKTLKTGWDIIRYDTLSEYLGIEESAKTSRIKQQRLREKVHTILDSWIKQGFITGYEDLCKDNTPAKPRKSITKVRIILALSLVSNGTKQTK